MKILTAGKTAVMVVALCTFPKRTPKHNVPKTPPSNFLPSNLIPFCSAQNCGIQESLEAHLHLSKLAHTHQSRD